MDDITKRKRAEEALRQSEERYRMLTESTTDMIYIVNRSGDILYANRSAAAGIRCDAASLVGRRQDQLFPPDKVRDHTESIARVFQTGEVHEADGMYRFGPEEMWLNTRLMPLRNERGEVTAVMGVSRNITDRKRAEAALQQARDELEMRVEDRTAELASVNEALRQSEHKYRGLVEASPDAVIIADVKGAVLFASHHTWEFLGLSERDELVGRSVFDFVVEGERPRLAANIADLMKTGIRRNTEYTARRQDGTPFPVEISSAAGPNTEQQPWAILAVVRDISERKQAEKALRQHYEELRAIYDGTADGLAILDAETTNCLRVNRAACDLVGYTEEELLGLPLAKLLPPERLTELLQQHRELAEGRMSPNEDVPLVRKDGSVVYVDIVSNQITYNGRPCLIHLVRDLTERRQAQEALEKEHRTLKRLLQSSDRERQLIAYEIHDGLAQQLAGAIMQIETCWHQKDTKPGEAAKAYEAAITMLRQAHFETRRLISGVRPPILDESGIVAAVAHLVNEQTLQNGPKIEFRGDVSFRRLVPILENAIYRIVQEGLANACKHSQSDRVRVELVQCDDVLRIRVQDWGVGFDRATVRDDRFGLEGIRERARLLGGRTSVESTPGHGTSITVELPLVLRED
jgi:PAS domain S-box-containing protein